MKNCVQCSAPFIGKRSHAIYCSRQCGSRAFHERRQARGDYDRRIHPRVCLECGASFNGRPAAKYCTKACADIMNQPIATAAAATRIRVKPAPTLRQCPYCLALHTKIGKFCGIQCSQRQSVQDGRALRSALRAAYEDNDYQAFVVALRKRVTVTDSGCWNWNGQRSKDGYPCLSSAGKRKYQVHRMVIEAKHSAPLGSQAAHHACANQSCVNPDHLQPVTHAENTAEMLSRKSYQQRIMELEQALAAVAPNHPLLDAIACA